MLFDRRSREGIEESRPAPAALVGLVELAARVELAVLVGAVFDLVALAVDSIIVQSFDHTETPV